LKKSRRKEWGDAGADLAWREGDVLGKNGSQLQQGGGDLGFGGAGKSAWGRRI